VDRKLGAMEPRGSGVVAWSMAVVAVLLSASAVLLAALNDAGTVVDKVANVSSPGFRILSLERSSSRVGPATRSAGCFVRSVSFRA
jgi:hypothetical protein